MAKKEATPITYNEEFQLPVEFDDNGIRDDTFVTWHELDAQDSQGNTLHFSVLGENSASELIDLVKGGYKTPAGPIELHVVFDESTPAYKGNLPSQINISLTKENENDEETGPKQGNLQDLQIRLRYQDHIFWGVLEPGGKNYFSIIHWAEEKNSEDGNLLYFPSDKEIFQQIWLMVCYGDEEGNPTT
jgi:hypothetical protein